MNYSIFIYGNGYYLLSYLKFLTFLRAPSVFKSHTRIDLPYHEYTCIYTYYIHMIK